MMEVPDSMLRDLNFLNVARFPTLQCATASYTPVPKVCRSTVQHKHVSVQDTISLD